MFGGFMAFLAGISYMLSQPAVVAGLIGGAAAITGAGINAASQINTNKQNQEINQTNLDYNAAMTQAQWERDDNAHQREVADLEKAGLSPLAATGGANTSAALGAPSPIAMQAPQVDVNALSQSLLGAAELSEKTRHNKVEEGIQTVQLTQNQEEIDLKTRQLDIEDTKVKNQFEIESRSLTIQANSVAEVARKNKEDERLKWSEDERKQLEYEAEEMLRYVRKHTGRDDIPYEFCSSEKEYLDKIELRQKAYIKVLDEIENYKNSSAKGQNRSLSGGGQVAGTGLNAGSASGSYNSESKDKSLWAEELLKKFEQDYPFPIPDFDKKYSGSK